MASFMKAVVIAGDGTQRLTQVPIPKPATGQVLIKVHATTVITSELATRAGVSTARLPLILGNDFVGNICEAPGAEERLGHRVIGGYGGYGYTRNGAWAEFICVDSKDAFPICSSFDTAQIAAIPGSFTAASGSLHSLGDLKGKTLLIHG